MKQFRDTMYEFNTVTEDYRAKSKDRIRRHLELGRYRTGQKDLEHGLVKAL